MRFNVLISIIASLTLATGTPVQPMEVPNSLPESVANDPSIIPDQYIVLYHQPTRTSNEFDIQDFSKDMDSDTSLNITVHHSFALHDPLGAEEVATVRGMAVTMDTKTLQYFQNDQRVQMIEPDRIVRIADVQTHAPWGLSRISQRGSVSKDQKAWKYNYAKQAGEDVDVYVVDTGHEEFEGRAVHGITVPKHEKNVDGNGHGTHVAATISGKTFGVAKSARVHAVKVLRSDGTGSLSDVIIGLEWVVKEHAKKQRVLMFQDSSNNEISTRSKATVINMSLGGLNSVALDKVVEHVIHRGIHIAVAAGNDFENACDYSPARVKAAVTVGASDMNDKMTEFSNYGPCVDIFAPGHDIVSAWIGSTKAVKTISGTSMASPHVAGAMAAILSRLDKPLRPKQLKNLLKKYATKNVLQIPSEDTANLLLFLPSKVLQGLE